MSDEYEDLKIRLGNVIRGTCNTVGCDKCGLKYDGGCAATDLEGKMLDIELKQ